VYWEWPDNRMGLCTKTVRDVGREGVVTMSEDGWEAGIYTGPEFGCVHYEREPE